MGIDAQFTSEVDADLLCPICQQVYDQPATNCKEGHVFCTSCWEKWFRTNKTCPTCRSKPLNNEPIKIRHLHTIIEKLTVRCDCGHQFSASHLAAHKSEECRLRPLDCPLGCGWQGPFSALPGHVPDECPMMYLACDGEGCGMILRRGDLKRHQSRCKPAVAHQGEEGAPAAAAVVQEPRFLPDAWKRSLQVGDWVDAQDRTKAWFEAVIVSLGLGTVKVHFKGWDQKWDEEIPLDSERIERLHTKTTPWRDDLAIGEQIEVKFENGKWGTGRISRREGDIITLSDGADSTKILGVFPISSDMICRLGTHVKSRAVPRDNPPASGDAAARVTVAAASVAAPITGSHMMDTDVPAIEQRVRTLRLTPPSSGGSPEGSVSSSAAIVGGGVVVGPADVQDRLRDLRDRLQLRRISIPQAPVSSEEARPEETSTSTAVGEEEELIEGEVEEEEEEEEEDDSASPSGTEALSTATTTTPVVVVVMQESPQRMMDR